MLAAATDKTPESMDEHTETGEVEREKKRREGGSE